MMSLIWPLGSSTGLDNGYQAVHLFNVTLRKTPYHPDMVFKGFIKFTGLPESKNGKNSLLKIFDVLLKTMVLYSGG